VELTRSEKTVASVRSRERARRKTATRRRWLDGGVRIALGLAGAAICVLLILIAVLLFRRAWPIIRDVGLPALLGGRVWEPHNGRFGFAPFVAGSVAVTLVAMVLAVVPAVLSGVYLAEFTSRRTRAWVKPMLDVLVGIPSVIYGLWGILAVVPFLRDYAGPAAGRLALPWLAFTHPSGYSVLAGGAVLAIMVFPLIAAVVEEVVRSAPQAMREALLSLGATRWEMTRCILHRHALAGILAAVVLGFSRAFGETLAVLMVVGNVPELPRSLFDPAYPLPALIANNYGEMMSVPLYESALMGAALALLVVVVFFNLLARGVILRVGRSAAA
jgi:phosphate transport system permease protein